MIDDSPPGSWRSALDTAGSCAVCCQKVCGHSDMEYAGFIPSMAAAAVHGGAPSTLPSAAATGLSDEKSGRGLA